jgi:hypothetical protein
MPKAAVNENHCPVFRKNDIGLPGKVFPMNAKSVAKAMKNAANADLGPRVRAAYGSHVAAALLL